MADAIALSSLTLVGTSQVLGNGTLRLTDNTDNPGQTGPSPAGAAWSPTTVNVANPFSVDFHFQMTEPTGNLDHGNGGDGIAFLIQNDVLIGTASLKLTAAVGSAPARVGSSIGRVLTLVGP